MKIGINKDNLYKQIKDKAMVGLKERLNSNINEEYEDRLNYELGCIKNNIGVMRYLLAISDIVDFARQNNILTGNGRGSSNSSLINYVLGITNIDPVKYDLIFENLYNDERSYEIDIDLECENSKVDIITNYIKDNYGYNDIIHFKIDILSYCYLDKIQQMLSLIGKPINLNNIDLDDAKVYSIFYNSDTKDIPQFETTGMQELLKKYKPTCFNDLVMLIAINRPTWFDFVDEIINKKNNKKNINYIDRSLKDILEPTFGLLIYHEQVLKILNRLCGFTYKEADVIRRNILKNNKNDLETFKNLFISHISDYINDKSAILKIYNFIVDNINKTFLKSHAISVALLVYQMAYLKVYYSDVFKQVMGNKKEVI